MFINISMSMRIPREREKKFTEAAGPGSLVSLQNKENWVS